MPQYLPTLSGREVVLCSRFSTANATVFSGMELTCSPEISPSKM